MIQSSLASRAQQNLYHNRYSYRQYNWREGETYLWSSLRWQDKNERESDYEDAGTVDEAIVVVVFVVVIVTAIAISATPRVLGLYTST